MSYFLQQVPTSDFRESPWPAPIPEEPALQDWLEEAYRNLGYQCYNWHKRERVNEKGMDIECLSTKEKIALAVKIRPRREDIAQLKRFSKVKADKLIYVYWSQPTKEFQRKLQALAPTVSPLTGDELGRLLIENGSFGYLKWFYVKSDPLQLITNSIIEIYECEHIPEREFSKTDLAMMWRMKSSAVKIKADIRLTKNYFGDIVTKQKDQIAAFKFTEGAFDMIYMMKSDASEFYDIVSEIRKNAPHLLRRYIDHVAGRTGGKDLDAAIQRGKKDRRAIIENWLIEDKEVHRFVTAFSWLERTLEDLEDRLSLLSEGVDWIFEEALSELWGLVEIHVEDE